VILLNSKLGTGRLSEPSKSLSLDSDTFQEINARNCIMIISISKRNMEQSKTLMK
jgi:hypothetical protein